MHHLSRPHWWDRLDTCGNSDSCGRCTYERLVSYQVCNLVTATYIRVVGVGRCGRIGVDMGKKLDVAENIVRSLVSGAAGWKNPSTQYENAKSGAVQLANDLNGGAARAGKTIKDRPSRLDAAIDAATDGTNDPTRVEYGGHRGSSTGQ